MLKGIPAILSPELLKVLCEMGHGDRICIGDGNFPGRATAQQGGCVFLRADGHGVPELLNAILQVMPLDAYVQTPVMLMERMKCDLGMELPIWKRYEQIVAAHDARGIQASADMNDLNSIVRHSVVSVSYRPVNSHSTQISFCRRAS